MRRRLLPFAMVVLAALAVLAVLVGGGAAADAAPAGQAPSAGGPSRAAQATPPSTLVVDRTVDAPAAPPPRSHLWVGLVVGVFGLAGLVWSRVFRPAGRPGAGPAGRSAA